jgi:hypothetical protein
MIDSDDVLLLRPVRSGFPLAGLARDPARASATYAVAIYYFHERPSTELVERFDRALPAGGTRFVTEYSANTYPRLPIREGEHVFVVFGAPAAQLAPELAAHFAKPPQTLQLSPTARSLLGYR